MKKKQNVVKVASDIQTTSKLFKEINLNIDFSKPCIVFITYHSIKSNFAHTYGWGELLIDYYREHNKDSNIIIIGVEDLDIIKDYPNVYQYDNAAYIKMNKKELKNSDQIKNNKEYNYNILLQKFDAQFSKLKVSKVFLLTDLYFFLLPGPYVAKKVSPELNAMSNEFHDYVGINDQRMETIKKIQKSVVVNIDKFLSLKFASMSKRNIFMKLMKYFSRERYVAYYGFVIDPVFFHPWFTENNLDLQLFSFENDFRGTREYHKFPLGQLQHLVYEDNTEYVHTEKTKDFIFVGSILGEKRVKEKAWFTLLDELKLKNSSIYVPLVSSGVITKDNGVSERRKKTAKVKYEDLVERIGNHPMFKGHLYPSNLNAELAKYRYGMVLRCISYNDSVNFRPILYTALNVIPILDFKYDPEYMQIPKDIQDKLIVYSAKDIEDRVKYYNVHPKERQNVLTLLKKLFNIDNNGRWLLNPDIELAKYF